jgi:hypothetical protein
MKTPEEQAQEFITKTYQNNYISDLQKEAVRLLWLAGYTAAREWHPIETAPKDGTRIRLYVKLESGEKITWEGKWAGEAFTGYWPNPTHWQPLSEPPKE